MAHRGPLFLVRWTKTHHSIGRTPVLLIPEVPGHHADPVATYHQLISSSPTASPNEPLLLYIEDSCLIIVMVFMLSRARPVMVDALGLDSALYSFHSRRRGVPQQHTDKV